jgi:excisionase family DNA binding protein
MRNEVEMFRPTDVAARLGVTPSRVYQLIAGRAIPVVRVGGAIRIPRSAWEAWLKCRSEEALSSLRRWEPDKDNSGS